MEWTREQLLPQCLLQLSHQSSQAKGVDVRPCLMTQPSRSPAQEAG